jgi:uncharacterized protein (DUF885 family)
MKKILILSACIISLLSCKQTTKTEATKANKQFAAMCEQFYQESLKINPLAATYIGDDRYNDLLANDGSATYLKEYKTFNERYLDSLKAYDRESLDANDKLSFDYLKDQLDITLEGFKYHSEYLPFNQMFALPLTIGQLGSGTGAQPFKTVKNYEDWLKRAAAFSVWADTAIANFRKGEAAGIVLPKALVIKMIPQMLAMVVSDPKTSLFYGPINLIPRTFSDDEKQQLTQDYLKVISTVIIPTYKRLGDFLQKEYLPKARITSGYSAMPGGADWYAYLVRQQTTTNKTPEEVYQTGLKEVSRIKLEMDSIKTLVDFKGDLKAFFDYMKTDKKFMPYKNAREILDAFENIHQRMKPNLKKMFEKEPKTPFEIRQTEAFRAASASAEYNSGSADGKRPGIFYVPILDAKTFNTTSGMESLFLHEAIPGHHYQISLTQENSLLPNFRRFGGHNAYVEGWALYCESLGKELGLYQDPYQHMGALGDEMHRAIRLVVDVAIHTKNMSREEAIKYMTDNEAISIEGATAEIERYMGIPGQALGYKTGAMKIRELRARYMTQLGTKFNLASFHTEVLKDGSLPLSVFESKMDVWADRQK